MRRALLVLAVVVLGVGASLTYFGTRSDNHREVERLPHLPTTTSSVLLPEGTWTFGSGPAGFVVGRMHITGGPEKPNGAMPDSPLPGVVEVHHRGNGTVLERVNVDAAGRFDIDLPVGNYQLIGRSPNVGEEVGSQGFMIQVGKTTHVDLVVRAT